MKAYPSDIEFGSFILSCMRIAKEAEDMCQLKCAECKKPLSEEEIQEARQNGLKMDDVCCDKCWMAWVSDRREEQKHPDEK